MKNGSAQFVNQTTKAVLITTVALSLLLPGGLAGAQASSTAAAAAASSSMDLSKADPSKVKFTKEQAIAKLRDLFPYLKNAEVSSVELGDNNVFPAPANQMIWNIQWSYRSGNSTHGFGSQVNAISGDVVNAYASYPNQQEGEVYYPPKLTEAQALEKAKEFVVKAASSIKPGDLHLEENNIYQWNESALFGPVQYHFTFRVLKNGVLSSADYVNITVNGNGELVQFSKPDQGLAYPSAQPKITEGQAQQKFADSFDVGLYYVPIYKNGEAANWILAWRPVDRSILPLDALNGKPIDNEGTEATVTTATYSDVPQLKGNFQARSSNTELSAEEAAKLVEKLGYIPAGRKLGRSSLGDYISGDSKIWRLTWVENSSNLYSGYPVQSTALVDAKTGEIYHFQSEETVYGNTNNKESAPAGAKKLTEEQARKRANELINALHDQASVELKLMDFGKDWSILPEGSGYRYQYNLYYNGIPLSDISIILSMDVYGRLLAYSGMGFAELDKKSLPSPAAVVVSKKEALDQYSAQYKVQLQYSQFGGYLGTGGYAEPKVKLVYALVPKDAAKTNKVIDALTGKDIDVYGGRVSQNYTTPTDLKGHAAEKELTELVKYRVIEPDENGKVNPDQELTVGEWFTWLAAASTPYYSSYASVSSAAERKPLAGVSVDSPYYNAVSFAAARQWIGKDVQLKTEDKLTREQLAVYLTSFIKYSKISAYLDKDIILNAWTDSASITDKGAAVLTVKLGLLQAADGKFNPSQTVTRAGAASVMMKLVELQGKTDQVIGSSTLMNY